MKTPAVLAVVLFAVSQLSADTQPATPPAPTPAPGAAATPAKPVDPKAVPAKPAPKKPEPDGVIPGQTVSRANGTFLGIQVINGQWVLSFYDKKKKPIAPDVSRATARWPNMRSATTGDNRAVLNQSGNVLLGNKPVVPPLVFNLRLGLLTGDGEDEKVVESFVIPFRG